MKLPLALLVIFCSLSCWAQEGTTTVGGWQLQDTAKMSAPASIVSERNYTPAGWYPATVPGTVLTTLVNNKVYPEPLYGENMRAIPESLNKTSYWYRTTIVDSCKLPGQAHVASLRCDLLLG